MTMQRSKQARQRAQLAPVTLAGVGVVDPHGLIWYRQSATGVLTLERGDFGLLSHIFFEDSDAALANLLEFMDDLDLNQLWLMPGADAVSATPERLAWAARDGWDIQGQPGQSVTDTDAWLHCYKRGTYTPLGFDLAYLARDTRSPFPRATSAAHLLQALTLYAQEMGLRFSRSPGATGARLLRQLHSGAHAINLDPPGALPPPAEMRAGRTHQDSPIMWKRTYTPMDLTALGPDAHYLSFDVNGQHLAATSSLRLGVGEPAHAEDDNAEALVDDMRRMTPTGRKLRAMPGYYRVQLPPLSPSFDLDGGLRATDAHGPMPGALYRKRYEGRASQMGGVWISAPTLDLLDDLGFDFWVLECYIYPEHHRLLEPWYKRVRDARANLMDALDPAAGLALAAVKATYTKTFGGLAYRGRADDDPLRRPDWRHAIIAQSRANLYRRMASAVDRDVWPASVSEDTLGYVTAHGDALALAFRAGLPVDTQLGHLKVKDCVKLAETPALCALLCDPDADMFDLQKLLAGLRQSEGN